MKFSHQLKLNSVPDWAEHYIAYSNLKKIIYAIERSQSAQLYGTASSAVTTPSTPSASGILSERAPLLISTLSAATHSSFDTMTTVPVTPGGTAVTATDVSPDTFLRALDAELERIVAFYMTKEKELVDEVHALRSDIAYAETAFSARTAASLAPSSRLHSQNRSHSSTPIRGMSDTEDPDDDDEDEDDDEIQLNRHHHHQQQQAAHIGLDPEIAGSLPSASTFMMPSSPATPVRIGVPVQQQQQSGATTSAAAELPDDATAAAAALLAANTASNAAAAQAVVSGQHLAYNPHSVWARRSMQALRLRFARRAIDLYVSLSDLRDFVQLNATGFGKVLKKFDKVTGRAARRAYLAVVDRTYPFTEATRAKITEKLRLVEGMYAAVMAATDPHAAAAELQANLRQHVTFERNTVWRDMLANERAHAAINVSAHKPDGATADAPLVAFTVPCVGWSVYVPRPSTSFLHLLVGIALFLAIFNYKLFETHEQQACFAVLIAASWLWATEALPLYVTALLIPPMIVLMRVIRDPVTLVPMTPHNATKFVFGAMFSPTVMLLMGGFAIAAALSKHMIAKIAAVALLTKAGTRTVWVLLANMMVATFASMWISNVAAPVLCFSIIQPILRTLPDTSSFGSALILGIALASNIGGMASPISSPQNVVAIDNMHPGPTWAEWFIVALPICIVTNVIVWLILLVVYQPHITTPEIVPLRRSDDKFTGKQWFIIGVTLLTIVLWCVESAIEGVVGDMGVIALLPIVVFYGAGILTKDDFNTMGWTVIMLAMGGSLLGKAVDNSGLLAVIATSIKNYCHGMSLWGVLFVFSSLVLVVATFISHTVAALIVLPIVAEVGAQMADPHPRLLVMGAALMCSGAMGLPISGFPNMNAIAQEDATGKPYLRSWDFIRSGVPGSVGVWLAILTMGYGSMIWLGF